MRPPRLQHAVYLAVVVLFQHHIYHGAAGFPSGGGLVDQVNARHHVGRHALQVLQQLVLGHRRLLAVEIHHSARMGAGQAQGGAVGRCDERQLPEQLVGRDDHPLGYNLINIVAEYSVVHSELRFTGAHHHLGELLRFRLENDFQGFVRV